MEFRLSTPPSADDMPAADAELLALLLGRGYCQERLSAAEAQENYPACAAWYKAANSGLPVLRNALVPQYAAVAQQQHGDGPPEPVLGQDVASLQELLAVLRELAAAYRAYPGLGHYGMSLDNSRPEAPYYAFTQKKEASGGGPYLYYEGCFRG